jgi:polyisoprenoid-binding protein YceI
MGPSVVRAGDRVRLRPAGRADFLDLVLDVIAATVEAVEQDFDGRCHLAAIVDDKLGKELGLLQSAGTTFLLRSRRRRIDHRGADMTTTATRFRIDPGQSRFTARVTAAGLLSFLGHSPTFAVREFAGTVAFVDDRIANLEVHLSARVGALEGTDYVSAPDRRQIEERMRSDVLDVPHHPEVEFHGRATSTDKTGTGQYRMRITGLLTVRGIRRSHVMGCDLRAYTDGFRLRGETGVRMSEFGIPPVTALGGTICLEDEVKLVFDFVLRREVL